AVVDAEMRRRMGEVAVKVAHASGYTNAGTVEFLVDAEKNFYFLEMNTRLQVEHPVTELVTGLDLVHLQLHIASGEPLPFAQEQIVLGGHAIECRIYAEDPDNNFFPSPGKITRLIPPRGPGLREDSGVYEGWTVPLDYDPMLSKLIAFAPTREMAIARLERAFDDYFIAGIKSNLNLFRRILADEDFRAARIDTGYLDRMIAAGKLVSPDEAAPHSQEETRAVLIAAALHALKNSAAPVIADAAPGPSGWMRMGRAEGLR
ncbi:MAG: acetyl-CoA carboxylase biotin carboxylase subunit, partial [Acidobacteriaceae bacterium]